MEIIKTYRENGFFTTQLYHLLTYNEITDNPAKITPSQFMREMNMSTAERMKSINSIVIDNIVSHTDKPCNISFTPRLIVFQNFNRNQKIMAKFTVKNISKGPTYLSMSFDESSFFDVRTCGTNLFSRLAPGISITFCVTFMPAQLRDYCHAVFFHTDYDKYVLPVLAIGPRPMCDFPDSVSIPKVPLKLESSEIITVRNVGIIPTAFSMVCKSPYSVSPKGVYLQPGEFVDIKISFKSMHLSDSFEDTILASFETGEVFRIKLFASTHTVQIELEKQLIKFNDTYNKMVRQEVIKITNRSPFELTFMCMKNKSVYADFDEKLDLAHKFCDIKSDQIDRDNKLLHYDILSSKEHERIYTRIFFDEIQALVTDETLVFPKSHFSVEPLSGKLWPNKATDITFSFNPKDTGKHEATVYLDIDGVTERVPILIIGKSLSPNIVLNLETLDVDFIYIGQYYNYELVAINRGLIDGAIRYVQTPTLFGSHISCFPKEHCLKPDDKKIFVIKIMNNNQGPFFEEITFKVDDSENLVKFYIKGDVIHPKLSFSVQCLDFGTVSLGRPNTVKVDVINSSAVNVSATCAISSDGPEISSICLEDYAAADFPKPDIPKWPREFAVTPSKIELMPESQITLEVTLTANLPRTNVQNLEVEVASSDSAPIILPMKFNAVVPTIVPAPDIVLRACFLNYPYHQTVEMVASNHYGYFIVEERSEEDTLHVEIGIKEGFIVPEKTICIPIVVQTNLLGPQEYSLRLRLFGVNESFELCRIHGFGVRPIVSCSPPALAWGQVKLLTETSKKLTLCNDSPVNVDFNVNLIPASSRWTVKPMSGRILPEGETELLVLLMLIDADVFTSKIVISMDNVKDVIVPLSATGIGTSIVIGEDRDKVIIGRQFTNIPVRFSVIMENLGTRLHTLEWSGTQKQIKNKDKPPTFFKLEPDTLKLAAGEKAELKIKGMSTKEMYVKEMWFLFGNVEGINKKDILMKCPIIADFVEPKVEMSNNVLEFQYDYGPYEDKNKLINVLTIQNVSKLTLVVEISVKPPFSIIQNTSSCNVDSIEEKVCTCSKCFDSHSNNCFMRPGFIDYVTQNPVKAIEKGAPKIFDNITSIKALFPLLQSVEHILEDDEDLKLQILFDVTKHNSLKGKTYTDNLKIIFKGLKNKACVKLIGRISFPNVHISKSEVDFNCIQNGSVDSKTFKMHNPTPLTVCYQFKWNKVSIKSNLVAESELELYDGSPVYPESSKASPDEHVSTFLNEDIMKKSEHLMIEHTYDGGDKPIYDIKNSVSYEKKVLKKIESVVEPNYLFKFDWSHKFPPYTAYKESIINDIVFLTPHRGILSPKQSIYVHVLFQPNDNIHLKAYLECEVLGGPSEFVTITGQSSDLEYMINSAEINFKIQPFYEQAKEYLTITNKSLLPFEYVTFKDKIHGKNYMEGSIYSIYPPDNIVKSKDKADIKITVKPGISGFFKNVFYLQIGNFENITIDVIGWGVIPQVYILTERPSMKNLSPEIGYRAIQQLDSQYLAIVHDMILYNGNNKGLFPQNGSDIIIEDPYLRNEWHIYYKSDIYPSTIDIEMAIERYMAKKMVKNPELINNYMIGSMKGPIPDFYTEPYLIDFGVVITDSVFKRYINVINYGPCSTKIFLAKGTKIPAWMSIKLCGKLQSGESGKIEFTFHPSSKEFTEPEQYVKVNFVLEIPFGASIPVEINALCAVPYLVCKVTSIEFGVVKCGNKVVYSIPLQNIGRPTCIWYVSLKMKNSGMNPISIYVSSGKLAPGEGTNLEVSFKPTMELLYEGTLTFRFHMNPQKLKIPIRGQGVAPKLHIIGPEVKFPATLPWSEPNELYFGIMNPCKFPIEIIIAHCDQFCRNDDELYNLLHKYYNEPSEILLPQMLPGSGYPSPIIDFYKTYTDLFYRRMATESIISTKKTKTAKLKDSPALSKNPSFKMSLNEADQISEVVHEMQQMGLDPLGEKYRGDSTTKDSDKISNKGLIICFHGSPFEEEESSELAYSVGKILKIPVINLDSTIIEALIVCEYESKWILTTMIDDTYKSLMERSDNPHLETGEESVQEIVGDPYEELSYKINYIHEAMNNTPKKPGDKKKETKKPTADAAQLLPDNPEYLIPQEMLEELLEEYLKHPKFKRGFVVDSLKSKIYKTPPTALTAMLQCQNYIGVANYHLVLCHGLFVKWAQAYEASHKEEEVEVENEPKVYTSEEIAQIVADVDEMDEEEYENMPEEFKQIYLTKGLQERRTKYKDYLASTKKTIVKKEKMAKIQSAVQSTMSVPPIGAKTSKHKSLKETPKTFKPTSEYTLVQNQYAEYQKNVYETLLLIANNWIVEFCEMVKKEKSAPKSPISTTPLLDDEINSRGFPYTVLIAPCLNYRHVLMHLFESNPVVRQALIDSVEPDFLDYPVQKEYFTELLPRKIPMTDDLQCMQWMFLEEDPIPRCECNIHSHGHPMHDTTQEQVLNILTKWHCICGKKLKSAQTSTIDASTSPDANAPTKSSPVQENGFPLSPRPIQEVKSLPSIKGRMLLKPGDLVRCKYVFKPREIGQYNLKRYVEVNGWPDSRVTMNITGLCDLPRLDRRPKKMFRNILRCPLPDTTYKMVYLDDVKVFEFGPIFIGKKRVYEEKYSIDLRNASTMTTNVKIMFLKDSLVFTFNKSFISLEPQGRDKLVITAAPEVVGHHEEVLLFCVTDNPEIFEVKISCTGVVPKVEVFPQTKTIDYGKLLLYRREVERFIVKNDSVLPIKWKISNLPEFENSFIIQQTSGTVASNDNQVVPMTFIACGVGTLTNKPLMIDIYDEKGRGQPMLEDTLFISGECYDVLVEYSFEDLGENFLNYGNIKVNTPAVKHMFLINKGKYNIYYKLKKNKSFPDPALLRSSASPLCGMVPALSKAIVIDFECTPLTSLNLVNVPAFTCCLLDGNKDQVVVAKFPVMLTITSFYNTFTLYPLGELNFGVIAVGTQITKEVIITNDSKKCPITFQIKLPPAYSMSIHSAPTAAKTGDKKIKVPILKCGNFTIGTEDYLIAPSSTRTISITFVATSPDVFEEIISFVVSDANPAEADGVPLKLFGVGAIPKVDFWNIENTFREHLIVNSLSNYKIRESTPHCVFVENSVTFHFFGVIVQTSHKAALDLYNNGLVPCALHMKLIYQGNTDANIFSLHKSELFIEQMKHRKLRINFTPKALEEYRAVLEIRLKQLDHKEHLYKICIIGEGVIPRIEMLSPSMIMSKTKTLVMPVTCLGSVTKNDIVFKNISTVRSTVILKIVSPYDEERPVFWLNKDKDSSTDYIHAKDDYNKKIKIKLERSEKIAVQVNYNPMTKGRDSCEVLVTIVGNPYEYYTVLCEGEAFVEDVIILNLDMLSLETPIPKELLISIASTASQSKKKTKAPKSSGKKSETSLKASESNVWETNLLRYTLDFGGCELCALERRTVIMFNNSDKVYKFVWDESEIIAVKPSYGFISPGEEKDIELMFLSTKPIAFDKEVLKCVLQLLKDNTLTTQGGDKTWDNRQNITTFERNANLSVIERNHSIAEENTNLNDISCSLCLVILYSATTQNAMYKCTLAEEITLEDTFILQKRTMSFTLTNVGKVPLKANWAFQVDDNFPTRIDRISICGEDLGKNLDEYDYVQHTIEEQSKVSLFSKSADRMSVDTWFEVDLPFTIIPNKVCLNPEESQLFQVTFAPVEAFDYKVKLSSSIANLDPYDQNITCKIHATSLIPYCHLDVGCSDYLKNRTETERKLPANTTVLEFSVLGTGCYKKTIKVMNPTSEGYEFSFEMADKSELVVPIHCNLLKGYVEAGTSVDVVFTFTPTVSGIIESLWELNIRAYSLTMNLLVVGIVKEPNVVFIPTILTIKNALVNYTITNTVILKNPENSSLKFSCNGNSLGNESGKSPIMVQPEEGVLKPCSETPIKIMYTPDKMGPLSFKIFFKIQHLTKNVTLCVDALSECISPIVTYMLIGYEHTLNYNAITNIHLDDNPGTRINRTIPFAIKNCGSLTFFYNWVYNTASAKKYLELEMVPKNGHVQPGSTAQCVLNFKLKKVPLYGFPITLNIVDGPSYNIYIYAEIKKSTAYGVSSSALDFGMCLVNAPNDTYKKTIFIYNNKDERMYIGLEQNESDALYVDIGECQHIEPSKKMKVNIYFRPKEVKAYELSVTFIINTIMDETVYIKGEGVKLLCDLYDGCQKNFYLGPVKVGEKICKEIQVMNHSKIAINASFSFSSTLQFIKESSNTDATSVCLLPGDDVKDGPLEMSRNQMFQQYKDEIKNERMEADVRNALSSLKITPSKAKIKPYSKLSLKICFKPNAMISALFMQVIMKVLNFEKPIASLWGVATGMSLSLSQNSLQFGHVRKNGCKILKLLLLNNGNFGTKFTWQPLKSDEFVISPMQGDIAARSNVSFTVTFRPKRNNPFIKLLASCNIDNYTSLDVSFYASCMESGIMLNKALHLECPVREIKSDHIPITNPTDDQWLVTAEATDGPYETLNEFTVEPNSTFNIPITFKPKSMGRHESRMIFSPLGDSVLYVSLMGNAVGPHQNGDITVNIQAKEVHHEQLEIFSITGGLESYKVSTEVIKIHPDKFNAHYEIKCAEVVKVLAENKSACPWSYICCEPCQMILKVMFINEKTSEYQYYNITINVTPSDTVDTIHLVSKARESVEKEIQIKNPTSEDVEYMVKSNFVQCDDTLHVAKHSEAALNICYSPLVVGTVNDFLEVSNHQMGTYVYKLVLTCEPAKEKTMECSTPFGTTIPLRLKVRNRTDAKVEFNTTISHPSITGEKKYALGPLEKGVFILWFEPVYPGVQNCLVSFDSNVAGEFVFNIKGTGTEPKPMGPYEVPNKSFASIPFKNVFEDVKTYKINIDTNSFFVKNIYETIKPKKGINIQVFMSESVAAQATEAPRACLTVEVSDSVEPIQWTYFLQGIL